MSPAGGAALWPSAPPPPFVAASASRAFVGVSPLAASPVGRRSARRGVEVAARPAGEWLHRQRLRRLGRQVSQRRKAWGGRPRCVHSLAYVRRQSRPVRDSPPIRRCLCVAWWRGFAWRASGGVRVVGRRRQERLRQRDVHAWRVRRRGRRACPARLVPAVRDLLVP
eukprot:3014601-Pleurochrysis_carterae.AAC.1